MDRDQRHKKDDLPSRLLSRVGSVFRRASRRTKSTVSAHQVAESRGPESTSTPASAAAGNTTSATATPAAPQPPQTSTATPDRGVTAPKRDPASVVVWSDIQQERARALFAKYGLSLEPHEWMSRNFEVQRVEKPIRMRVRRTCHRCQTTFGADRVCANCQHVRCKTCPRYPPARTKEEKEARALAKAKGKQPEKPSDTAVIPTTTTVKSDDAKKLKSKQLTMESQASGHDLVYRPVRQRVRRRCHQCQTAFVGFSTECETCGHVRCKICPREPPNPEKYPEGYPGDEEPPIERPLRVWKKPRMRVRWFCHKCDTFYPPGDKICRTCGEEKGPNSRREPPKKEKPPIDEELMKRVRERLEDFRIAADNT
ncbi:conserved hypothetical protein [Talaromyces stipitatus ATCC 10500]|uniref:Uncharacterized protein n=1 Tax=Talaromyces stipitatus (strain ATCC 10500 / CBS 375.48 / QM 6759 / NRRL 1006) TaxID=441959 RepID=B8LSY8_TALSN|nr:uncharacterized protein TSTA_064510 [Talaromyces stipitatus ATCC 10500]EED22984.1 conserved hypothetical protein [Talaromyces stipitatus ATCC 10500]